MKKDLECIFRRQNIDSPKTCFFFASPGFLTTTLHPLKKEAKCYIKKLFKMLVS